MEYIIKIQHNFFRKKLRQSIIENVNLIKTMTSLTKEPIHYNLFDKNQTVTEKYNELKKILMSRNNIIIFDNIIRMINKCYKIELTSKKLMTAWIIIGFPEFVLGKDKNLIKNINEYPDDIYFIAKNMIESFIKFPYNKTYDDDRKFFKIINQYTNAINYFLLRDKTEQINKLIVEYIDIYKTIKSIESSNKYDDKTRTECLDVITKMQHNIAKHIFVLNKDITIDILNNYAKFMMNIENVMHIAYHDVLYDDIINKQYTMLTKCIDDIRNIINIIEKNSDINEILDVEYIISLFQNLTIDNNDIVKYGEYLVSKINKFQTINKKNDMINKWTIIKNNNYEIEMFLTQLLIFIMRELHEIIDFS